MRLEKLWGANTLWNCPDKGSMENRKEAKHSSIFLLEKANRRYSNDKWRQNLWQWPLILHVPLLR